jgi:hypothetical protein
VEEQIVYFEKAGEENTSEALRLVRERASARGIDKVVLASTRGNTARSAMEAFANTNIKLVVVPWQFGFAEMLGMGEGQRFPKELVSELEAQGHQVYFGTMLFHTEDLYGSRAPLAMANVLRVFCQGIKVCVEILLMAANGGLVITGEKVIAIAGTVSGADTAVVATAAPSTRLAGLHINEIICKPL